MSTRMHPLFLTLLLSVGSSTVCSADDILTLTLKDGSELSASSLQFEDGRLSWKGGEDSTPQIIDVEDLTCISFPEEKSDDREFDAWIKLSSPGILPARDLRSSGIALSIEMLWGQEIEIPFSSIRHIRFAGSPGIEQYQLTRSTGWSTHGERDPKAEFQATSLTLNQVGMVKRQLAPLPLKFIMEWTSVFEQKDRRTYHQLNMPDSLALPIYERLGHHFNIRNGEISYQWKSGGTTDWVTWFVSFSPTNDVVQRYAFRLFGDQDAGTYELFLEDQLLQSWSAPLDQVQRQPAKRWLTLSGTQLPGPIEFENVSIEDRSRRPDLSVTTGDKQILRFLNGDQLDMDTFSMSDGLVRFRNQAGVDLQLSKDRLVGITFMQHAEKHLTYEVELHLRDSGGILCGTLKRINDEIIVLNMVDLPGQPLRIPIPHVERLWFVK